MTHRSVIHCGGAENAKRRVGGMRGCGNPDGQGDLGRKQMRKVVGTDCIFWWIYISIASLKVHYIVLREAFPSE